MGNTDISKVLEYIDDNFEHSLERLKQLLAYKSISTDLAYKQNCKDTAQWLVNELTGLGFKAQLRETPGHPMVVAHSNDGAENTPHVLFYGHYDVQPVDPIELWHGDPFVARREIQNGEEVIVARGSSDDKGQLMTFIEACRAYKAVHNSLPIKVSILFEGEEESGSPSLIPFLKENKNELKADFALVCDTSMWDRQTPSVTVGLRGMLAQEIVVKAAERDLHSGIYGGVAANPLTILAKILGEIKDVNGHINIPDFYEGVEDTPPEILAMWQSLGCEEADFLGPIGLSKKFGEQDRTLLECIWARPTAEINGIEGGYTGAGFKTVIPSQARAKISFRLVHRQDPEKIRQSFKAFVKQRIPSDCTVEFIDYGASPAIQLPYDLPFLQKASAALTEEWGKDTVLIASGGSIPVVGDFQKILDMQSLLVGFALDDDNIHSPNEKYDVKAFHKGQRSWARILAALA
ncbi:MAG: M20/M25/M40 family metallo-hydrolase [Alphaproteobacteria bacterium]|nr:M20/M25/M40 family metallo-hydrolase [Alphaproteobacteria bacterium]